MNVKNTLNLICLYSIFSFLISCNTKEKEFKKIQSLFERNDTLKLEKPKYDQNTGWSIDGKIATIDLKQLLNSFKEKKISVKGDETGYFGNDSKGASFYLVPNRQGAYHLKITYFGDD